MMEFAMGPAAPPALHLVALRQHLKRGSLLYDSLDDRNGGGYVTGEESMTCLTNSADSGGCQWPPVSGIQWMKRSAEKMPEKSTQGTDYGLQGLYCAVAQHPELSSQNDQKSDWSEESKSGDAGDSLGNGDGCNPLRDYELAETGDGKYGILADYEDSTSTMKRFFKDDYEQQSPECNNGTMKPQLEKFGWKSVGRHAENRRKRWAQADPLLDYWKGVSASKYAAPFRRPVALLEDYDTIIRQPMDLSTIRRQLENNESYSLEALRRDVMLMVTNAMVYNKKGTETYDMALKLKSHASRLFEGNFKEASYPNSKLSPVENLSKTVAKATKTRHTVQLATDPPAGSESLPLAPIKKHRTMRRPRLCISSDVNGLPSEVANGSAVDSSSEEEAAAVLICFSSGKSGDDKQSLSTSKAAKSESPRKRLKRVELDADITSACSVTQREGLPSHPEQCLACTDGSIMSAGPSSATSIRGLETRPTSGEPENYVYVTAMESSQTKKVEKPRLVQNVQAPFGTTASVFGQEGCLGSGRSKRACMGLKHKWQERWRMQSAAVPENSAPLQQATEPVGSQPSAGDKYAVEGVSGAETNYRLFPQTAGACTSVATSGVAGILFGQKSSPVSEPLKMLLIVQAPTTKLFKVACLQRHHMMLPKV
ncbi:unnamed protein product [Calypogeia fissa]